jgi:nucleotide-binding universal stress UspA family protein
VLSRSRVPLVLLRPGGRRVSHLRTLLVPVDSSPGGALALGGAVGLAQTTSATLRLLEVVVPIPAYVYAFPLNGSAYIDPAWDDEAQTAATTYVDGIVARLRGAGLAADGEVRVRPSVAEAIVATAEERDADLIVMSTQALVGPARALLGSVTDAVVRTAHCPVLVLHREPARPRPPVESKPRPDMVVTGS